MEPISNNDSTTTSTAQPPQTASSAPAPAAAAKGITADQLVRKTLDDLFPADRNLTNDAQVFELVGKTALHVRRVDNPQFEGFVEQVQKKHKFQFDHNLVGESDKVKFLIPGIARYLLTGWEEFPPEAPVPYSAEAAEAFLGERKSLVKAVLGMANQTAVFVRAAEEKTTKN